MKTSLTPFLVFTFLFLSIANWQVVATYLTSFREPKVPGERIENPALTAFIKNETNVHIPYFYIVNSDLLFAGMTGIPFYPVMTISKELYQTFSNDELAYILMHETGHYVHFHSLKIVLLQFTVVVIAFYALRILSDTTKIALPVALLSAVLLSIGVITVSRGAEWQADEFALSHIDDPESMIRATQKLEGAWDGPDEDSVTRKLLYSGIPYSKRIEFAESYK